MDIKNIISKLMENGNINKTYYMVETLILKVLKKYFEDINASFEANVTYSLKEIRSRIEFDAFSSTGFDKYHGGTVFEIKLLRNKESVLGGVLRHSLRKIEETISQVPIDIKNIILVIVHELTEDEKTKLEHRLLNGSSFNIHVWDLNKLQSIFNQYPELVVDTIDNISKLVLDAHIVEGIKNEKESLSLNQQHHISNLKTSFVSDDIVLFVGAGISKDAQISMWNDLTSDLLVSLLKDKLAEHDINLSDEEQNFIINELKSSNGSSPILMARFIRHGLQETFIKILSEILYKKCVGTSEIIEEITRFCRPVRNGIGIRGIVTYNFDDLLEVNFEKNDIKHRTVYSESVVPTQDELGIFHVHGFLPRAVNDYENLSKSLLVFSEEGYHHLINDPYNWSNLVQLNYLREHTCLFIGLSLTDPNLRRILDIAVRKQETNVCRHFVILKRELYHRKIVPPKNQVNQENIKKFDAVNQKMQEEYHKELGLNVLWVDDYKEITTILQQIRN